MIVITYTVQHYIMLIAHHDVSIQSQPSFYAFLLQRLLPILGKIIFALSCSFYVRRLTTFYFANQLFLMEIFLLIYASLIYAYFFFFKNRNYGLKEALSVHDNLYTQVHTYIHKCIPIYISAYLYT